MSMKLSCIDCAVKNCDKMDKSFPEFCLTTNMDTEVLNKAMALYMDEENHKVTVSAAMVETEYYCQMTRVEEIAEFAKRMVYKKIGIATCVGLLSEARTAAKIFRHKGFEVYGVASVSYTHLDVYKRQIMWNLRCRKLQIILEIPFT